MGSEGFSGERFVPDMNDPELEIEQLESKESIYAFGDNNKIVSGNSETEKMILRLQSDRRGILADVLIKHGRMKCAEELYKKIEK